jgi:uncharacterized protein (TIGR00369 family)
MQNDPKLQHDLAARMASAPFYGWAGISLASAREGHVQIEMEVQPHHLNLQGFAHGGMVATLADTACGLAVRTQVGPGRRHVTAQLNVVYLAPARPGRIVARGSVVRVGVTIAYAEAEVVDARGRTLARATSVLSVMPERD